MNNLADIMHIVDQVIAGAGASPAPARTRPQSKPPINVALFDLAEEIWETIHDWTIDYLHVAKPSLRIPNLTAHQAEAILTGKAIPLNKMTRYADASQLIDDVDDAMKRLKKLIHYDSKTWIPLGNCSSCGSSVSAPLGEPTTQCRECGETIDVEARKLETRKHLEEMNLPRAQAREAVRLYAGKEISDGQLDLWAFRKKITPKVGDQGNLYNVGQLIHAAGVGK